jgi:hypothetical protein
MVSTKTALISSTITAGLVTASYAGAKYVFEGTESLGAASVAPAGLTVFGATFALSFAGMKGWLPF